MGECSLVGHHAIQTIIAKEHVIIAQIVVGHIFALNEIGFADKLVVVVPQSKLMLPKPTEFLLGFRARPSSLKFGKSVK